MAFDYINEAFKRLEILDEEMFDASLDGVNALSDFLNNDDTEEVVRIIDPEASAPEELQDSYVGKVIINCNVCHSHVFEQKEDIVIDEDGTVNTAMQCPYCGEQSGFTIVGEIAPFTDESESTATDPSEDPSEDSAPEEVENSSVVDASEEEPPLEESAEDKLDTAENRPLNMSNATRRVMGESFQEVSITTEDQHMEMSSDDDGKVTVTTEPINKTEEHEEMVVPVSPETESEILDNNDSAEETSVADAPQDELEFNFDEVDEEGLDELGESYFTHVYDNVASFKTTGVGANDTSIIVEGLITFTSGVSKKTGFMFEAKDVNKRGQVRFTGSNKHLCESTDAFSLVGRIDNNKLFVESLKYNYDVDNQAVRGCVRRK